MKSFKAFRIDRDAREACGVRAAFVSLDERELDAGDVLIRVAYSSVNQRDAQAITRADAVRRFPCVGGVDLAGTVLRSAAPRFRPGDAVIATSYGLGVSHHGGYAEIALLPGGWVLPCPPGLSLREAMAVGTAGLAAALAITRMEDVGLKPENGPVVVTGASGGVGSLSIDMLAGRGYEVVALTGKPELSDWLYGLGAAKVMLRSEWARCTVQPLDKAVWAAAVDNLGGPVLASLLAATKPGGVVASVGQMTDAGLNTTLKPFVQRGVSLLGVDSVYAGFGVREKAWARIAGDLRPRHLTSITREVAFEALPDVFGALLAGCAQGRTVVRIGSERQE